MADETPKNILRNFGRRGRDVSGNDSYYRKPDGATSTGERAQASGSNATAVGAYSNAVENNSTAVGVYARAAGQDSTSIGEESQATAADSTHVGQGGSTSGIRGTSVGQDILNTGQDSSGVGQGQRITGTRSTAVGQGITISHDDVTIVGKGGTSDADGQVILGTADSVVSHIWLGRGTTHTGAASFTSVHSTEGTGTDVAGDSLYLVAGRSTGSASGGSVAIYTCDSGASSSSLNASLQRVKISGSQFNVTPLGSDVTQVTAGLLVGPTVASPPTTVAALCDKTADGEFLSLAVINNSGDANAQYASVASGRMSASGKSLPLQLITRHSSDGSFPRLGIGATDGGNFGGALGVVIYGASGAAPTGGTNGYMGVGTLNVQAGIYLNGTLYNNPDYVLEQHFTGKIELTADRPGAANFPGIMPLEDMEAYAKEHFRLPLLDHTLTQSREARKQECLAECSKMNLDAETMAAEIQHIEAVAKADSIGDRADAILAQLEELAVHMFEMNKRLKTLEAKNGIIPV